MKSKHLLLLAFLAASTNADELIFRYQGDVSPSTLQTEWITGNPCDGACSESLEPGHLVFSWPHDPSPGDRFFNYTHIIGVPPDVPEPPLWVEWRFASNNEIDISTADDGTVVVDFRGIHDLLDMYGDTVISFDGGNLALDLELDQFRTFRFETISDEMYCFWFDGVLLTCDQNDHTKSGSLSQT